MTSQVLIVCINCVIFLAYGNCVKYETPSNFYGSSEVISGYLSEQQQYIDAFSLHPGHNLILGTIENVEYQLDSTHAEVKFG